MKLLQSNPKLFTKFKFNFTCINYLNTNKLFLLVTKNVILTIFVGYFIL